MARDAYRPGANSVFVAKINISRFEVEVRNVIGNLIGVALIFVQDRIEGADEGRFQIVEVGHVGMNLGEEAKIPDIKIIV